MIGRESPPMGVQGAVSEVSATPIVTHLAGESNIPRLLAAAGIRRGSGSWADYEEAKKLIIGDAWDGEHDSKIAEITRYLNV
ncbi:MAG: hypothetical protein Kow0025_18390 [Thermodesulfovibrionales bacterium]